MARQINITSVMAGESDRLYVEGTVDGVETTAQGWQSAVTNFFPPEAFGPNGNPLTEADPESPGEIRRVVPSRHMTSDEANAYFASLLDIAAPKAEELKPFNFSMGG